MRKVLEKIAKVTIDDEDGRLVSINIDGKELEVGSLQSGFQLTITANEADVDSTMTLDIQFADGVIKEVTIDNKKSITFEHVVNYEIVGITVHSFAINGYVVEYSLDDATIALVDDAKVVGNLYELHSDTEVKYS